jgi:plasmid replication initiation protein
MGRLPHPASERARLDPFDALAGEVPQRDQRDLMERPFFSLAKAKRTAPILYRAGDVEVQVYAVPEHGMATIWDADVLIWSASHLVEAADRGWPTSRFFRFTPYQLLGAIGRGRGQREYRLLKGALARLQSTVIRTTIRQGEHWRRQQFSWINEWEELVTGSGRVEGMEFVLPDWFYQGVLDRHLVLTIDPAYFQLTGGLERWLYRVARKHAGSQTSGWRFDLRHLHAKSASLARFSDFALDLRRLVARQPLPGYALALKRDAAGSALLDIRPVEKLWTNSAGHGTSGASAIGTSGARGTGLRAHETGDLFARSEACAPPNLSNRESNFSVVGDGRSGDGTGRKGERGGEP